LVSFWFINSEWSKIYLETEKQKDLFTVDRLNIILFDGILVELKFDVLRPHSGTTSGKPDFESFSRK
jgi:hypothetical protein